MTTPPQAPLVHARGLEKTFGTLKAVDGLDLDLFPGECLGLLGPNGAGKTTTLGMLATLLKPSGGQLEILGLDPRADAAAIRAGLGVVPQEIALYGELSGAENLAFFGRMYGLDDPHLPRRVAWGLHAAGLADRGDDLVRHYSGGMKRRLNIVAALLHEPRLVLLDEPTVGVDPQSRGHIFEMVEELRRGGLTLIYTTHQLGEVERLCDRILILDHGRALAEGTLAELRAGLEESGPAELRLPPGTDPAEAARILREGGIQAEIAGPTPDLEEVFLSLTGRALRDEA